jgi:hypothetical protein
MAQPNCPRCEGTSFTFETNTHAGVPTLYIYCNACGCIVGVVNKK